jgi:hypothetical protein
MEAVSATVALLASTPSSEFRHFADLPLEFGRSNVRDGLEPPTLFFFGPGWFWLGCQKGSSASACRVLHLDTIRQLGAFHGSGWMIAGGWRYVRNPHKIFDANKYFALHADKLYTNPL